MGGAAEAAKGVVGKFSKQDVVSLLIVVGAIAALGVWVGLVAGGFEYRISALEDFKATGSRCTGERCRAIETQQSEIKDSLAAIDSKLDSLVGTVTTLKADVGYLRRGSSRLHWSPNDLMPDGTAITGQ